MQHDDRQQRGCLDHFGRSIRLFQTRGDLLRLLVARLSHLAVELGADIGDAMRVFANEMRSKRLLRAEEYANTLPVKMLLPLGLFIFPVLMMMIMGPAVIKVMAMFRGM